jgi:hypothetical protein
MRFWICVLLTAFVGTAAYAQHDDIVPYELDGKIATGGHDDVLGTDNIAQRVFGYDFGEVPENPYVIGDPGVNNGSFAIGVYPNDGLLPAQKTLGFSVVTNLLYWDGSGGVSFAAAPSDVLLGLNNPVAGGTVLVSGTGQSGTPPIIQSTGATGRVHMHLLSQLHHTDGTDPTPPNAPDGMYLVGLSLTLPGSGLTDSDPFYVVYLNNSMGELNEAMHDAAIEWAETTLVPEPASWALMIVALGSVAAAGLWKQRRAIARH